MSYVQEVLENLKKKNPDQPEFIQARFHRPIDKPANPIQGIGAPLNVNMTVYHTASPYQPFLSMASYTLKISPTLQAWAKQPLPVLGQRPS